MPASSAQHNPAKEALSSTRSLSRLIAEASETLCPALRRLAGLKRCPSTIVALGTVMGPNARLDASELVPVVMSSSSSACFVSSIISPWSSWEDSRTVEGLSTVVDCGLGDIVEARDAASTSSPAVISRDPSLSIAMGYGGGGCQLDGECGVWSSGHVDAKECDCEALGGEDRSGIAFCAAWEQRWKELQSRWNLAVVLN